MSQLRISFFAGPSGLGTRGTDPVGSSTLVCSSAATLSANWVVVPALSGQIFATFEAFGASIYVDIAAASPDPTSEPRQLVPRGGSLSIAVSPSFRISAVEASDIPASASLVQTPVPSIVVAGQVVIATTGMPVQLPSAALQNGIVVKSLTTNSTASQTIGGAGLTNAVDGTGNGYVMLPGEAAAFAVANANLIYVNGTAGDVFTYQGN